MYNGWRNLLWSENHSIEVGRRIEPYHLYWLEDPVVHDDYAGLARVADALTTPIAAGEYQYGIVPFRHLLEGRSIDVVMALRKLKSPRDARRGSRGAPGNLGPPPRNA